MKILLVDDDDAIRRLIGRVGRTTRDCECKMTGKRDVGLLRSMPADSICAANI